MANSELLQKLYSYSVCEVMPSIIGKVWERLYGVFGEDMSGRRVQHELSHFSRECDETAGVLKGHKNKYLNSEGLTYLTFTNE